MKAFLPIIRNDRYRNAWIVLELLIVFILALIRPPSLIIVVLVFCALRLLTGILSWEDLGFIKIKNIPGILLLGLLIALSYQIISILIIVPIVNSITNSTLDLSGVVALKDNWLNLVIALLISWTFAAFGEEIAYRSYLFQNIAGLFPNRRMGSAIGVLLCTALFALGHGYQGISGVVENAVFGLTMAFIFLFSKRNIWLPIIIHGFVDTIGFILIFSGVYP